VKSPQKKTSKLRVVWDVFAHFPCNANGVRVGVRRSRGAAIRYMGSFSRKNRVETTARIRLSNQSVPA
jgi:hypothetical protein